AGRDPDGARTQLLQVVELGRDAVEVADPVVVGVGEAARVDLVDDLVLPPLVRIGGGRGRDLGQRGRGGRGEGGGGRESGGLLAHALLRDFDGTLSLPPRAGARRRDGCGT